MIPGGGLPSAMLRFRALAFGGTSLLGAALLCSPCPADAADAPPPFYALLVAGGPDVESNAAQIEGHVHFVAGTLPASARRVVLFADGRSDKASVSYADTSALAEARRALAVLLADHDAEVPILNRAPALGVPLDGSARLADLRRALGKLSAEATRQPGPLLLYFAGHGNQSEKKDQDTAYDLWESERLKVRTLADEVARLPRQMPVVLVMAQCFSGAFANLLFAHGDPDGEPTGQDLIGFFSAAKDREAAGCSYATERADYQDFSSYFFGALCGHDRFGGTVTGADYDGDGSVSLHEAFCYALVHDQSADTPVCTSDVFLRRISRLPDDTIYSTPYRQVWQSATPAQRAALDALSAQIGLTGEDRAVTVFDRLTYGDGVARPALLNGQNEAKQRLAAMRQEALGPLFARRPALRWGKDGGGDYRKALDGAVDDLAADGALRRQLIGAEEAQDQADGAIDNEEASLLRFACVYEHVVEAAHLREHGRAEVKAQFDRLWRSEQRTLPLAAAR